MIAMKKTNEFTVKVQTNNELTEKQIEALIDKMFFSDEKIFYAERINDYSKLPANFHL